MCLAAYYKGDKLPPLQQTQAVQACSWGVKPIKPFGEVIVGVEDGLEVLSEFPMGFRVNSAERWLP